jgi:hypothetical protein
MRLTKSPIVVLALAATMFKVSAHAKKSGAPSGDTNALATITQMENASVKADHGRRFALGAGTFCKVRLGVRRLGPLVTTALHLPPSGQTKDGARSFDTVAHLPEVSQTKPG